MPQQQNSPKSDLLPDSCPRHLADLLERNYAMMHRMRISQSVLEAEVELLRDLLFEAIAYPATADGAAAPRKSPRPTKPEPTPHQKDHRVPAARYTSTHRATRFTDPE